MNGLDTILVGEREKSGNLIIWIPGKLVRKSNQRKLRRAGGKPLITKSDAAIQWIDNLLKTMPGWAKLDFGSRVEHLHLDFWCFYKAPKNPSHEPDLSVELQLDGLQKSGVIKNDRYVYSYLARKVMTSDIEGVVVEIARLEGPNPYLSDGMDLLDGIRNLC
jgi:hypothetical protein